MASPADAPNIIPRSQLALFITGDDGTPLDKVIQDFEDQQLYLTATVPADVATAQATADSALAAAATAQATANTGVANAATAQTTANTANTTANTANTTANTANTTANAAAAKLAGDTFLTTATEATLPQSRKIAVSGTRLQAVDGGAGANYTISLTDQTVILPADVAVLNAFSNTTGLLVALAINSTYILELSGTYQCATAGTGLAIAFTVPAGASIVGGWDTYTAATTIAGSFNNASGTAGGATAAVPLATTNYPIRGRWVVKTAGTAGNAQMQHRSSSAINACTFKQDLTVLSAKKIA